MLKSKYSRGLDLSQYFYFPDLQNMTFFVKTDYIEIRRKFAKIYLSNGQFHLPWELRQWDM